MHILLVEDDDVVAEHIQHMVKQQGWLVTHASTVAVAEEAFAGETFDLAVIDWMLPDGDGVTLVRKLRERAIAVPVLLLTARSQAEDIVTGLESGADDFLTKPFAMSVLIARIQALLRRPSVLHQPIITIADLQIDTNKQQVSRANKLIALAPREYQLLEYLARHCDVVIDRLTLLHHVWGSDVDEFSNTIDVHIRYLRKKIDEPFTSPLIHTVKQKGYVLCAEFKK